MPAETMTPIFDRRTGRCRYLLAYVATALLVMQGSTLAQGAPEKQKPPAASKGESPEKRPADKASGERRQASKAPAGAQKKPEKQEETEAATSPAAPAEQPAEQAPAEQPEGEAQAPAEQPEGEEQAPAEQPAPPTEQEAEETPAEKPAPEAKPAPAKPKLTRPLPPTRPSRFPVVSTSRPSAGTEPLVPHGLLAAELGFAASKLDAGGTGYWISPLLKGWFRLERTVAVEAEWGSVALLASSDPDGERSGIGAGNPYLGFYSVRQHGPTVLRIGLGMTIPVATLSGKDRDAYWDTYQGAMAMRGMWKWWLWVPDSISLAIPVSWDSEIAGRWLWGGEAGLAATVILPKPARSTVFLRDEPRTADLLIPLELYAGYRFTSDFIAGALLQGVFVTTGETELQLSLSPYGKLELGQGFLEARFTANLDRPLGFAFEKGRFWGIHLGGGYCFW